VVTPGNLRPISDRSGILASADYEYSFTPLKTIRWTNDLSDLLVSPRPAAMEMIVVFPEAAPELQPDLARATLRCGVRDRAGRLATCCAGQVQGAVLTRYNERHPSNSNGARPLRRE
jgi:hypothetical protein